MMRARSEFQKKTTNEIEFLSTILCWIKKREAKFWRPTTNSRWGAAARNWIKIVIIMNLLHHPWLVSFLISGSSSVTPLATRQSTTCFDNNIDDDDVLRARVQPAIRKEKRAGRCCAEAESRDEKKWMKKSEHFYRLTKLKRSLATTTRDSELMCCNSKRSWSEEESWWWSKKRRKKLSAVCPLMMMMKKRRFKSGSSSNYEEKKQKKRSVEESSSPSKKVSSRA